jgi:hypothetical protein
MSPPATTTVSTALTCGTISTSVVPPTTNTLGVWGSYAGVSVTFNSQLGGVGTSFSLVNPQVPGSPDNVLQGLDAGGAGWQSGSAAFLNNNTTAISSNQSDGNAGYYQHGYDALLSTASYQGNEALNISMLLVAIDSTHGYVISIRHQLSLNPQYDLSWSQWAEQEAFYMNSATGIADNLRVYVGSRSGGWVVGPFFPWRSDYPQEEGVLPNGSRVDVPSDTGELNGFSGIDYVLMVWNVHGEDIGIVSYDIYSFATLRHDGGASYCSDTSCGLDLITTNAFYGAIGFPKYSVQTYTSKYLVGSPDQLAGLGFKTQ